MGVNFSSEKINQRSIYSDIAKIYFITVNRDGACKREFALKFTIYILDGKYKYKLCLVSKSK